MSVRTSSLSIFAVALLTAAASAQPPAMVPPAEPIPPMAEPTPPQTAPEPRVAIPALGPVGLAFDFDFLTTRAPGDNRQVFNFSVGLFGSNGPCAPPAMTGGPGRYCPPAPPQPMTARTKLPDLRPFPGGDLTTMGMRLDTFVPSVQPAGAFDVLVSPPVCPPCPLPKIEPNPLLGTWYREMPGAVIVATFTHDELKLCVTQMADGLTVVLTVTAHYALTKDGLVFGAVTGADAEVKGSSRGELASADSAVDLASAVQRAVDAPFSFRVKATSAGVMVSRMMCATLPNRSEMDVFGGMFKLAKDGKIPAPAPAQVGNRHCPADCGYGQLPPPPAQRSSTALPNGQTVERVGVDSIVPPPPMLPPPAPAPVCEPFSSKRCGLALPAPAPAEPARQFAGDAFNQLLQQAGVTRPAGEPLLPPPPAVEHYPYYLPPPTPVRPAAAVAPKPVAVGTWTRDVAGKLCVIKVEADHLTLTLHDAVERDGKVATTRFTFTCDYHLGRDGQTAVGIVTSVDVSAEGEPAPADFGSHLDLQTELQKGFEGKPFALTLRNYGSALVIGNVQLPQADQPFGRAMAACFGGRYKAAGDAVPQPRPVKVGSEVPPMAEPTLPGAAPGARNGDYRQLQNEWRRFWFNDVPGHLTPERVHGGIY